MKIMVINGPNINMTGIREKGIYGKKTYEQIKEMIEAEALKRNVQIEVLQSNHEGEIIDFIQRAYFEQFDGIIINPGAYTHTSYAISDALRSVEMIPAIEVHLSNVHAREEFRRISKTAPACAAQMCGFGEYGYILAMDALIHRKETEQSSGI